MVDTGLISILADNITKIATSETLGFYSFLQRLINMFIPSGGGQWAVQGPVAIEAAKNPNVEPYVIVLEEYGDQWTNMIQPFWTIPLLLQVTYETDNGIYFCYFYYNRFYMAQLCFT